MSLSDNLKSFVLPCFDSGFYTNHGPSITFSEKELSHLCAPLTACVYGSRLLGVGVPLWIFNSSNTKIYNLKPEFLNKICHFMRIDPKFSCVENVFDFSFFDFNLQKFKDFEGSQIIVIKKISLDDLIDLSKKNIFDCIIVLNIIDSQKVSETDQDLDYAILLFKSNSYYVKATKMRSSYGASEQDTTLLPTLNARPSEIIGNLLNKKINSFQRKNDGC